jgi:hypothetical protein
MAENRREKFKRLATYRTNSVLHTLKLIGNLSNKSNYEYSEEEVRKIFNAIENEIRVTKTRFLNHKNNTFKL